MTMVRPSFNQWLYRPCAVRLHRSFEDLAFPSVEPIMVFFKLERIPIQMGRISGHSFSSGLFNPVTDGRTTLRRV
jgi:hypothetical protein